MILCSCVATCIPADCCFNEMALRQFRCIGLYKRTSSSFQWNATYFCYDITDTIAYIVIKSYQLLTYKPCQHSLNLLSTMGLKANNRIQYKFQTTEITIEKTTASKHHQFTWLYTWTWTTDSWRGRVHLLQWPRLFKRTNNKLHKSFRWQYYYNLLRLSKWFKSGHACSVLTNNSFIGGKWRDH